MIFAVPSDAQAPCFYRGEAEPDCLAECGGIDVGNPVLITNPTIRKVQALSGYIAVGVWCVVGREPKDVLKIIYHTKKRIGRGPCLNKNLLCPVRCARRGGRTYICGKFLKSKIGSQIHPPKCPRSVDSFWIRSHAVCSPIHRLIIGAWTPKEHCHIVGLTGGGVNAISVARIRRCCCTGPNVTGTQGALQCRICDIMIWWLLEASGRQRWKEEDKRRTESLWTGPR
jgi:hypothetical protein